MRERTDHVIAVLVTYQILQVTVSFLIHSSQYFEDLVSLPCSPKPDASLDHITCEFVLGVDDDSRDDQRNDGNAILFAAVFNDMLRYIIAILVRDQL